MALWRLQNPPYLWYFPPKTQCTNVQHPVFFYIEWHPALFSPLSVCSDCSEKSSGAALTNCFWFAGEFCWQGCHVLELYSIGFRTHPLLRTKETEDDPIMWPDLRHLPKRYVFRDHSYYHYNTRFTNCANSLCSFWIKSETAHLQNNSIQED